MKKLISLALALIMILGMFPTSVFAASGWIEENGTFYVDLNDQLKGIDLGDQDILVGDRARYFIRDNVLYIQLLTGSSGRNGSCSLDGIIDLTGIDTDEDGGFELNFAGEVVDVIAPEKVPGLWVDKYRNGDVYTDGTDYFQKFYVAVGSNNQDSTEVVLTDTYDAVYTELVSIAWSDGTAVNYTTDAANGTFTVDVGTVPAGYNNQRVL